jgi:hypothetical protein
MHVDAVTSKRLRHVDSCVHLAECGGDLCASPAEFGGDLSLVSQNHRDRPGYDLSDHSSDHFDDPLLAFLRSLGVSVDSALELVSIGRHLDYPVDAWGSRAHAENEVAELSA